MAIKPNTWFIENQNSSVTSQKNNVWGNDFRFDCVQWNEPIFVSVDRFIDPWHFRHKGLVHVTLVEEKITKLHVHVGWLVLTHLCIPTWEILQDECDPRMVFSKADWRIAFFFFINLKRKILKVSFPQLYHTHLQVASACKNLAYHVSGVFNLPTWCLMSTMKVCREILHCRRLLKYHLVVITRYNGSKRQRPRKLHQAWRVSWHRFFFFFGSLALGPISPPITFSSA